MHQIGTHQIKSGWALALAIGLTSLSAVAQEASDARVLPPEVYGWAGLIPGGGHAAQGDWVGAGVWGLGWAGAALLNQVVQSRSPQWSPLSGALVQNLYFYSLYDAWDLALSQETQTPRARLGPLLASAWDVRHAARPDVLLFLSLGLAGSRYAERRQPILRSEVRPDVYDAQPDATAADSARVFTGLWVENTLTGVGEEALFRGFFQQSLERRTNAPTAIVLTSSLFGLAHWRQCGWECAVATGALGAGLGTMASLNRYDLKGNVFAHALFNTVSDWLVWREDRGHPIRFQWQMRL